MPSQSNGWCERVIVTCSRKSLWWVVSWGRSHFVAELAGQVCRAPDWELARRAAHSEMAEGGRAGKGEADGERGGYTSGSAFH